MTFDSQLIHKNFLEEDEGVNFWEGHHNEKNNDSKRHYYMLQHLAPLFNIFSSKQKSWLTIGDRHGREGVFLKKSGVQDITCSDLFFKKDLAERLTKNYDVKCINVDVENIPYKNDAVDFILCKETFHHFPRPFKGLYEMLRCAKYGVILMEPQECRTFSSDSFLLQGCRDEYEDIGNYKYELSARECCKIAWALRYPHVLFRGFNDGVELLYNDKGEVSGEEAFQAYLEHTQGLNNLGAQNKRPYNLLISVILKREIEAPARSLLSDFKILDCPVPPLA